MGKSRKAFTIRNCGCDLRNCGCDLFLVHLEVREITLLSKKGTMTLTDKIKFDLLKETCEITKAFAGNVSAPGLITEALEATWNKLKSIAENA